jgi:hypothetical protein
MELLSDFGGTLLQQYVKGGPAMHPISVHAFIDPLNRRRRLSLEPGS